MKKILLALPVLLLIALAIWFFSGNTETPLPSEQPAESPFGSIPADSTSTTPVSQTNSAQITTNYTGEITPVSFNSDEIKALPKLFKISSSPVAGFVNYTSGTSTVVRFVDRGTGHIFDTKLPSNGQGSIETSRITNTTISPIYEAYFKTDGNSALFRLLNSDSEVENILITLTAPKATSTTLYTLSSLNLRGDIDSPFVGVSGDLFYIAKDTTNVMRISFGGQNQKTLWNSGLKNWRISTFGTNLLVFTKPTIEIPGFAYSINSTAGGLPTKLLGPLDGLVAVGNKSGTKIFYSYHEGASPKSAIINTSTKAVEPVEPPTIADKCVWGNKSTNIIFCGTPTDNFYGNEPDRWYKGSSSFKDYIWKLDTETDLATFIVNPTSSFGVSIDVFRPALSPNEDYLVFMNKVDLSLWAVSLK